MEILFLFWIVCGICTAVVANSKNLKPGMWFFIGILLGPIALLTVGFMTSASKQEPLVSESAYIRQAKLKGEDPKEIRIKCPFCAEQILIEAKICRFCGKDLPIQEVAPPKVFEPSQLPPLMLERLKEADLLLSCGKKSGALASYVAITRAFPDFPEGWLRIEFMDNATPVLRAEVAKNLERLQALTT